MRDTGRHSDPAVLAGAGPRLAVTSAGTPYAQRPWSAHLVLLRLARPRG